MTIECAKLHGHNPEIWLADVLATPVSRDKSGPSHPPASLHLAASARGKAPAANAPAAVTCLA